MYTVCYVHCRDTCEGLVKLYRTIATVSGDNPGSSGIAGFKESSAAYILCRQCLATKTEIQLKVCFICPICFCLSYMFL